MAVQDPQRAPVVNLSDLQNLKQKFENEMSVVTDSIQKLQAIQQHFLVSQESTKQLETLQDGEELLVPLCDGLLVRGKTADVATSLVEVGAGYFVEMTHEKCRAYFKRRIEYVNTQIATLQKVGQEKFAQRQHIIDAMQRQMAQMRLNVARPPGSTAAAR